MKDFPKWMLALAGINLIPLLVCPLFLFGGVHPFGTSGTTVVNFLLYLLTQLLWVVPVVLFFASLDYYRRGFYKTGVALGVTGVALTVTALCILF